MAKVEIVMPQMGESITTGTITKWNKAVGDKIELDEILLEISTDKVESEIPSPVEGRVSSLIFEEGETIDVGKTIALIEDDDSADLGASAAPAKKAAKAEIKEEVAAAPVAKAAPVIEEATGRRFYTPLVKKMATDAGIALSELSGISGSGAGGRVNRADLEAFMSSGGKSSAAASRPAPKPLGGVESVGANGERIEIIKMGNMRKAIAKNMVASKLTSPHVNSIDEIDMSGLVKFREAFKDEFFKQEGFKLTYTHFIMYAIVEALKDHPLVNASIDGDDIIVKKDINLGCAVAVPGSGLVVPVIKNADSLSVVGIARELNSLAAKARAKKLTMGEMTGGTFTFTNVGSFGTLLATPVILQPQVGIFAAGVIKKRVMVLENDSFGVRSMMYGTHTYDHRLVDGELGGIFLASVKRHLENIDPKSLF